MVGEGGEEDMEVDGAASGRGATPSPALDARLASIEEALLAQGEALARIEAQLGKLAAAPQVAPVVVRVTPLGEGAPRAAPVAAPSAPRVSGIESGTSRRRREASAPPAAAAAPASPPPAVPAPAPVPVLEPAPAFDLEAWLGGAWLNKIGVAVLVFGVAFFVKHAFDEGWIGPAGRIWTGILFAAGMIGAGERSVARGLRGFGQGLLGGGVAVLYVSFFASFQLYHLVPQEVAFGCMAVTTALAVAAALRHDAQGIAVMGLLGGFLTPALVSTGQDAQVFLLSYVLLLDVALILVALRKSWHLLNHLVFFATQITLGAWCAAHGTSEKALTALVFALAYAAVFAATPLLRALRLGQAPGPVGIGLAIGNAVAALCWTLGLLEVAKLGGAKGTATLLLAGAYAVQAWVARGLTGDDRRLFHALVGVAMNLAVIAVPIECEGPAIPLIWTAQASALVYAGLRFESGALRGTGALLHIAAVLALVAVDESRFLSGGRWREASFLLSARGATYAAVIGLLFVSAALSRRAHASAAPPAEGTSSGDALVAGLYAFLGHALSLGLLLSETHYSFERSITGGDHGGRDAARSAAQFALSTVLGLYGTFLVILGFARESAAARWSGLLLLAVTIGKVFLLDLQRLETIWRVLAFMILGAALIGVSFLYQKRIKEGEKAAEAAAGGPPKVL